MKRVKEQAGNGGLKGEKQRIRPRKVVVPGWAEDFVVSCDLADTYLVETEDGIFPAMSEEQNSIGLVDFLASYYRAPRRTRANSRALAHVRFLGAEDDSTLISFISDFGPVHARVERQGRKVVAYQNRRVLQAEQKVFGATNTVITALKPLAEFCRAWFDDNADPFAERPVSTAKRALIAEVTKEHARLVAALREALKSSEQDGVGNAEWKEVLSSQATRILPPDDVDNLSRAHDTLCSIFNVFAPRLYFAGGDVIEAPSNALSGIRPLLYFMLREVYLHDTCIRRCQRGDCGAFFIPDRADVQYCSTACGDVVRQRRSNSKKRQKS